MPISSPPRNVSGMLEKPPMAAAPTAWRTRNVRTMAFSPSTGRISTPVSAANVHPIIDAVRRTDRALVPCSPTSSVSSTTERIATPVRDRRKNR